MKITIIRSLFTGNWELNIDGKTDEYFSHEDCLQIGLFNSCSCGMPEENLRYILGGLELIADRGPDTHGPKANKEAFDIWWDTHQAAVLKHHGSQGAAYFFYYWADNLNLTEHGGAVPGWLTEKGQIVLELLRAWNSSK